MRVCVCFLLTAESKYKYHIQHYCCNLQRTLTSGAVHFTNGSTYKERERRRRRRANHTQRERNTKERKVKTKKRQTLKKAIWKLPSIKKKAITWFFFEISLPKLRMTGIIHRKASYNCHWINQRSFFQLHKYPLCECGLRHGFPRASEQEP